MAWPPAPRDEDVPVLGAPRSLAGPPHAAFNQRRQTCGEAQHFQAEPVRTLWTRTPLPSVLTPGRQDGHTAGGNSSSSSSAEGWIQPVKAWASILSSVIRKPCFAKPQSFSLKGWACYFQDSMICFILIKNIKICHLYKVIYTLKALAFSSICSSSNSVSWYMSSCFILFYNIVLWLLPEVIELNAFM